MTPDRARLLRALLWAATAALAACGVGACVIQPQPLPPGAQTAAEADGGARSVDAPRVPGSATGGFDDAASGRDAGAPPAVVGDGGPPDGGDAGVGDGGPPDGGDAGVGDGGPSDGGDATGGG